MNVFLRAGLVFCVFATLGAAADSAVKVSGSRELKLAVVDTGRASAAREGLHEAFATALGQAVSARCGSELAVRHKRVGADQAAFNLEAGVYDAVLVLTGSMPRPLVSSSFARLVGSFAAGKSETKVYLVYNPGDPALSELLVAAYPAALNAPAFLKALEALHGPVVVARNE